MKDILNRNCCDWKGGTKKKAAMQQQFLMLNVYCNWLFFSGVTILLESQFGIDRRISYSLYSSLAWGGVCVYQEHAYAQLLPKVYSGIAAKHCFESISSLSNDFDPHWNLITPKIVVLETQTAIGRKLLLCKSEINVVTTWIYSVQKWHLLNMFPNRSICQIEAWKDLPIPAVLLD